MIESGGKRAAGYADARCTCGHKRYDHLGVGRCNDASRRCRCTGFQACTHDETRTLTTDRTVMTVCADCRQVMP